MSVLKAAVVAGLAVFLAYYLTKPTFLVHDPAKSAVLVTGATSGLGKDAALALDQLGFTVFAGFRKSSDGEALAAAGSTRLVPVLLDVTDEDQINSAFASVVDECNARGVTFMGLVNNAGTAMPKSIGQISREQLVWQYNVNVFGLVAVTNKFLPELIRNHGRVVTIGSLGALYSPPGHGLYTGTKAALEAIHDSLRRELRIIHGNRVPVSLLETGGIKTKIVDKLHDYLESDTSALHAVCSTEPDSTECGYALISAAFDDMARMGGLGEPSVNTESVVHALTSATPNERYLVGTDSNVLGRMVKFLPDRVLDSITVWAYTSLIDTIKERTGLVVPVASPGAE